MSTGFPKPDAAADFARERRRQTLATLAWRVSRGPSDAMTLMAFDDVVGDRGRLAEHDLGLRSIALASIVGSVSRRGGEFDRQFRPRARRLASRWQRIAVARRRGLELAPIDVYRVGELHFVLDGHHRVSVARALGDVTIEANVRQVQGPLALSAEARGACRRRPLRRGR